MRQFVVIFIASIMLASASIPAAAGGPCSGFYKPDWCDRNYQPRRHYQPRRYYQPRRHYEPRHYRRHGGDDPTPYILRKFAGAIVGGIIGLQQYAPPPPPVYYAPAPPPQQNYLLAPTGRQLEPDMCERYLFVRDGSTGAVRHLYEKVPCATNEDQSSVGTSEYQPTKRVCTVFNNEFVCE